DRAEERAYESGERPARDARAEPCPFMRDAALPNEEVSPHRRERDAPDDREPPIVQRHRASPRRRDGDQASHTGEGNEPEPLEPVRETALKRRQAILVARIRLPTERHPDREDHYGDDGELHDRDRPLVGERRSPGEVPAHLEDQEAEKNPLRGVEPSHPQSLSAGIHIASSQAG